METLTFACPSNHGTFFVNQMAALQIMIGDYNGAKATLTSFFSGAFKEQITAIGEQPFEAIRTRPYHYRSFNLEALIVNAKLADQLGLNMWTAKTKYNSTIQSAIDYTMRLDPKGEDAGEMVPHVLVAIAAYGDPKGNYIAWVKKTMPEYDTRIYHVYNQPGAFVASPVSTKQRSQPQPAAGSPSAAAAAGKRDLDHIFDQHIMEMQMQPEARSAAIEAIVANDTASALMPLEADQQEGGRGEDIDPRAVSDWHNLRDFTWLAPPLRFAKRLADQATTLFWTGGPQFSKHQQQEEGGNDEHNKAAGKAQTLAGAYRDVLHMREQNGGFTD